MKKKILSSILIASLAIGMLCGCQKKAESSQDTTDTEQQYKEENVVLAVKDAAILGEGVSFENEITISQYDEETNTVANIGKGSTVTYTVPENVDGNYDVYLTVSKCLTAGSSAPFTISINDEPEYQFYLKYEVGGDSEFAYNMDGEYDTGKLTDTGRFLISKNMELKAGDVITITARYGCRAAGLEDVAFPNVGDILLAASGSKVETGYDYTVHESKSVDEDDPLSGLNIIWLGSSVTFGAQAGGYYSMADAIADNHEATICEKYAISGTTLVNTDNNSYVERMRTIDAGKNPDLFIVQLSTNDATSGKPLGEIAEGFEPSEFDDSTIAGAIETIISHVETIYGCPVVFYTGSYYESEEYETMVNLLLEIQKKWGIGVVDLFNNEEVKALYQTDKYNEYMSDEIHPFRKGYIEWWTPYFEEYLTEYLAESKDTEKSDDSIENVYLDGASCDIRACRMDGKYYINLNDAAAAFRDSDRSFEVITNNDKHSIIYNEKQVNLNMSLIDDQLYCELGSLAQLIRLGAGSDTNKKELYLVSLPFLSENEEVVEKSSDYTKTQVITFEKLGIDINIEMNEEETAFYMFFDAFGDEQILYGTVSETGVNVEYDKTGFFTNDIPDILALVNPDAWEEIIIEGANIPSEYEKVQTVYFENLDVNILLAMDAEEKAFWMSFKAFGDDQLVSGTVNQDGVNVEYDKTGFFTNDVPQILSLINSDNWCLVDDMNMVTGEFDKYQTIYFEPLDLDVLVLVNENESSFCLAFKAFGDNQLVSGTLDDGIVSVEYDKTGFFTNDAQTIYSNIVEENWQILP